MSDILESKFQWLKTKQDQKVKNFGMVGVGYVVEYHNLAVSEIKRISEILDMERKINSDFRNVFHDVLNMTNNDNKLSPHDAKIILKQFINMTINESKMLSVKLDKLKQIVLLTDESVSDVEMNNLTMRQWAAYCKYFPEEEK